MYPTLLRIGSFRVDTYSVVWFIALAIAIHWSINRLSLYELDEDESRKIMAVSFFCMLLGARSYEYILHWRMYLNNPKLLLDLNRGGLHEFGAVMGAFLSAWVMSMFSRKVSFMKLCDVAAIPAMQAIAVGRWGCFLNGCCVGLRSNFFTAVHFPRDPAGVFRHPVQIYYSVIAALCVVFLLWVEKKIMPRQKKNYSPVIAPLALILYTLMRYVVTITRDRMSLSWLIMHTWTYKYITIALPLECLWLAFGLRKLKRA